MPVVYFIYSGGGRDDIPQNATHVAVHQSVTVIPARLFYEHPNIIELICHDGVEKIEERSFFRCLRLRQVIMRGVKVVEAEAFYECENLQYIACPKLERIGRSAFSLCKYSMRYTNLTSVKEVEEGALSHCKALKEATFGNNLESIKNTAFYNCPSLERITIPLKNGWLTGDAIFQGCRKLECVDLVEGAVLRETIATLLLEEWRNDMIGEIESINWILRHAPAGVIFTADVGGKGQGTSRMDYTSSTQNY